MKKIRKIILSLFCRKEEKQEQGLINRKEETKILDQKEKRRLRADDDGVFYEE